MNRPNPVSRFSWFSIGENLQNRTRLRHFKWRYWAILVHYFWLEGQGEKRSLSSIFADALEYYIEKEYPEARKGVKMSLH